MTTLPNTAAEALATSYTTFWEWFSQHEQLFFQIVKDHARVEEDFFAVLSPALDTIKPGFYFQTGMFDESTVELQISAEGAIENIVFVEDLIRAAPTIPGWLFTALKTASDIEHTTITMAGTVIGMMHTNSSTRRSRGNCNCTRIIVGNRITRMITTVTTARRSELPRPVKIAA